MRYLILIYNEPGLAPDYTTPEGMAEMEEWGTYSEALAQSGALVAGEALQPVETATTVRQRDGETKRERRRNPQTRGQFLAD